VPADLMRDYFLATIYHVEILIVVDTDKQLIVGKLYSSGYVSVLEVDLS
jgi:hypothetical protein